MYHSMTQLSSVYFNKRLIKFRCLTSPILVSICDKASYLSFYSMELKSTRLVNIGDRLFVFVYLLFVLRFVRRTSKLSAFTDKARYFAAFQYLAREQYDALVG